ncbi:hypothetical protein RJZ56_008105 [Blastomyces dermatitidis]|uniref:Uncharacterized protein n=1 Tax=Blastomyces gilchristii (strain SLH14081) TaxID=559298 RepID=A0A179UM50_BLAGS|nr:uncharacterized protein BDBG_04621 [Blastomyces gilchristii SLH14081]EQL37148.1 hypothetical protein BDFG_01427 [Blastomyces dermatitidis ATCC 26199]OAT09044.1 hypothetical protein BDBG_04621 [Blastomyces gilchristii SLH14081]
MAQGELKKSKAASSAKRSNVLGPKKGARVIAPKKANLIRQKKITKKISSGLTARTERALAERAGHLELLAGGKKSKDGKVKK